MTWSARFRSILNQHDGVDGVLVLHAHHAVVLEVSGLSPEFISIAAGSYFHPIVIIHLRLLERIGRDLNHGLCSLAAMADHSLPPVWWPCGIVGVSFPPFWWPCLVHLLCQVPTPLLAVADDITAQVFQVLQALGHEENQEPLIAHVARNDSDHVRITEDRVHGDPSGGRGLAAPAASHSHRPAGDPGYPGNPDAGGRQASGPPACASADAF